jgi:hypothetical protein
MRFFTGSLCTNAAILAGAVATTFAVCAPPAHARPRSELALASSAEDPALIARLVQLSPGISPEEARRVASTAYTLGQQLAREWQVVSSPTIQNFLINIGAKKAGYCFQWANELLLQLDTLKLKTLELHWVEADVGTDTEHNVIVVTARGQPYAQGILLDNWRHSGHLFWGPVSGDPGYAWKENKTELIGRLQRRKHYSRTNPGANFTR